jgi:23S rRNA (pseudouridine1915-N3)-methyltransferase
LTIDMKITIIAVGKIKEKYFTGAVEEYSKRLGRYCKLTITELADEKTPDGASPAQERQIKEKEGERILKALSDGAYVIALAIEGKTLSSRQLANRMEHLTVQGESHLVFIIGGSLGLDERVIARADELLSFSAMTFPHQLMRVILLEQIYRSFRIIHNEPYHK